MEQSASAVTMKHDLFVLHSDVDSDIYFLHGVLLPSLALSPERIVLSSELPVGGMELAALEDAIATSRVALILLSPALLAEPRLSFGEVLAADYAIEGKRHVVPVVIESCKVPRHLKALVTVDLSNPRRRERGLLRLRKLFPSKQASSATLPSSIEIQPSRLPSLRDGLFGRMKSYALSALTALGLIGIAQSAAAFIYEPPSAASSLPLPVCSKKIVTSALREMMRQSREAQREQKLAPVDGPGQLEPVDNGAAPDNGRPNGPSPPGGENETKQGQERPAPPPRKPTFKEQKELVTEMVQDQQYRGALRLGRALLAKRADLEVSELCFISLCALGRRLEGLPYFNQLPLTQRSKVDTICSNISPR